MKKTLLSLFAALMTLTVSAQSYTEDLVVTINNESAPAQPTTVEVVRSADNTTCTFKLNNFVLMGTINVGNIVLEDVTMTADGDNYKIAADKTILIQSGSLPGVPDGAFSEGGGWLGPDLGPVPVVLTGGVNDNRLYANIDIDMKEAIGDVINVVLGDPEATGIQNVTLSSSKVEDGAIYNLQGVRVNKAEKGIYIIGGRKVIK